MSGMMRARILAVASGLAAMGMATPGLAARPGAQTQVEVWRNGDDGVTLKLAEAVTSAFRENDAFQISSGARANSLMVVVQSPTEAVRSGIHYKLVFPVRFTTVGSQTLGFTRVTCQENTLDTCADQVVNAAGPAAAKLGRR
ncbi:MAG: hypothetical protein PW843_06410 [Azospirillaceae bacterium]|nr:hypothetical protein [Azospirillaceae bacterium]